MPRATASRLSRLLGVFCLCLAATLAGCGEDLGTPDMGHPPDGGWIINGHPFLALGQATVAIFDDNNTPRGFMVYLADQEDGCAAVARPLPTAAFLRFQLPISPKGVTSVDFANTVFGFGENVQPAAEAKSGVVNVQVHTLQETSGNYDVVFVTGEHLTGIFNAPRCQ